MHIYHITAILFAALITSIVLAKVLDLRRSKERTTFLHAIVVSVKDQLLVVSSILVGLALLNFVLSVVWSQGASVASLAYVDKTMGSFSRMITEWLPGPITLAGLAALFIITNAIVQSRERQVAFVAEKRGIRVATTALITVSRCVPKLSIAATLLASVAFLSGNFSHVHTTISLRLAEATDLASSLAVKASDLALEDAILDLLEDLSSDQSDGNPSDGWKEIEDFNFDLKNLVKAIDSTYPSSPDERRKLNHAKGLVADYFPERDRLDSRSNRRNRTSSSSKVGETYRLSTLKTPPPEKIVSASVKTMNAADRVLSRLQVQVVEARTPSAIPDHLRKVATGALADVVAKGVGVETLRASMAGSNPVLGAIFDGISNETIDRIRGHVERLGGKIYNTALSQLGRKTGGGAEKLSAQVRRLLSQNSIDADRISKSSVDKVRIAKESVINAKSDLQKSKNVSRNPPRPNATGLPKKPIDFRSDKLREILEGLDKPIEKQVGSCPAGQVQCLCGGRKLGCRPTFMCIPGTPCR